MIVRYAIANVESFDLAHLAQDFGLQGSVTSGYGFGKWGLEPSSFLEVATDDVNFSDLFVRDVLFAHREECAYRTIDGLSPALLYVDGSLEAL